MPVLFCFPFTEEWILFQLILGPKTLGEKGLSKKVGRVQGNFRAS